MIYMENGKIKFVDQNFRYGHIIHDDGHEVYFLFRELCWELKILAKQYKIKGEKVSFTESVNEKKEEQTIATNIVFSGNRTFGNIDVRDENGIEKVYVVDSNGDDYFLHYTNLRNRNVRPEDDVLVVFSKGDYNGKPVAQDVVIVDQRQFIERFASFERVSLDDAIQKLAEGYCKDENWDYLQSPTNKYPILKSYLNQTCKRIVFQKKLVLGTSSRDGREYCCFNTGLADNLQREIFAYFGKNITYNPDRKFSLTPEWYFLEFATEDDSNYSYYFEGEKKIATYFEDSEMANLFFDYGRRIVFNWEHIKERRGRIDSEEIKKMNEVQFRDAIEDSVKMAEKRIRRNYKAAIPHFYHGKIQLLIPLCDKNDRSKAIAAMVVQRIEKVYEVVTILSLDQAYNNARLLAKPDREWLNP